jgi:hemolysin III
MSSLYHALYFSRAKAVFQKLDHSSILLLIAGSYTPFVLYLYSGWQLILILASVWVIAVMGIIIKTAMPKTEKRIGTGLFIGFGWLALLLAPRFSNLGGTVVSLLVAGGLFYTVGVWFMAFKKPFVHLGWHMMVVLAASMHYFAILKLV